ncbi:autotransporter outer membrane beta-barrel domain-containing protein [Hoeflea prorocentri]|uniref:Autotransporter domain-containing protein n=1 Tax=Hoeflea prorocentri TaxID=1922333 RepID=A0A9X3UN26_9HYPH|nr:autotransporter outer membrane beta-barrel domain-containing protein [Hoeflea prorocentri]MCY6383576.1 hypothetical protein [Hoeflea prorocentri]MDA5401376.1 hypothetical protein [Hoeflea prorocentri]
MGYASRQGLKSNLLKLTLGIGALPAISLAGGAFAQTVLPPGESGIDILETGDPANSITVENAGGFSVLTLTIPGPPFPVSIPAFGVNVRSAGDDGELRSGSPRLPGPSGNGGTVEVTNSGIIEAAGLMSGGIRAVSQGGDGVEGFDNAGASNDFGGDGGNGADVTVSNSGVLTTSGQSGVGLFAASLGGDGGDGADSDAGLGGNAGSAGIVMVENIAKITTNAARANGISAISQGGDGGQGGDETDDIIGGTGGTGGLGGAGSDVFVTNHGLVETFGNDAFAVFASSTGGAGGAGGKGGGVLPIVVNGGSANNGGRAGDVDVTNFGTLTTSGVGSSALFVQSVGGGGGVAGTAGNLRTLVSLAGSGGAGADAGDVSVDNYGQIETRGAGAHGLLLQSIGGGGGSAGFAVGLISIGGTSGDDDEAGGADGGRVNGVNHGTITTEASYAYGVIAQSVGGGGGGGGFNVGAIAIGGEGSTGGDAGAVEFENSGIIRTSGDFSGALLAQSTGGGGGVGGGAVSIFSIGGSGSFGGDAKQVDVTNTADLATGGHVSFGVKAQSIGGGGGAGGFGVSAGLLGSTAIGGSGGSGGSGSVVNLSNAGSVVTDGALSHAVVAQSIGGGGGTGGFAVAGSIGIGVAVSSAFGGRGGDGGDGGAVTLVNDGMVQTMGAGALGVLAQSAGGGGGAGGFAAAGAVSIGVSKISATSVTLALGGSGGGGGSSDAVILENNGSVSTSGDRAHAIVAQSVGGGGGSGGFTGSASVAIGVGTKLPNFAVSVGIGGTGGDGGHGKTVSATSTAALIHTSGRDADGILAQSVGGGGGEGGFALGGAAGGQKSFNVTVQVGGEGGAGGNSDRVQVSNSSRIVTEGLSSVGLVAQSVGGGGGSGGFVGGIAFGLKESVNVAVTVGGKGGDGGNGGTVFVENDGVISTGGELSSALLAQSVGGGGGTGGAAGIDEDAVTALLTDLVGVTDDTAEDGLPDLGGAGSFGFGAQVFNASVTVGGTGGKGGDGNDVVVQNAAALSTSGAQSAVIFLQSVGGGGGQGGVATAVSASFGSSNGGVLTIGIGGKGGAAGVGKTVSLDNSGNLISLADGSSGIFAQSVGGGGGQGGSVRGMPRVSLEKKTRESQKSLSLAVTVGGRGGGGGAGGTVDVLNSGIITTEGALAHGIDAQSVGGGGGTGGDAEASASSSTGLTAVSVAVGGFGGSASNGGSVGVQNTAAVATKGIISNAIRAQSVGGGGGAGGRGNASQGGTVAIGGFGGAVGDGGLVEVTNSGALSTGNNLSHGIFAQSVGGGGGDGGNAVFNPIYGALLAFGEDGGEGFEQFGEAAGVAGFVNNIKKPSFGIGVGGFGGASGSGGSVSVNNEGSIFTQGAHADGIFIQSVGGGGGVGGDGVVFRTGQIVIGGIGGSSGNGGSVSVVHDGTIQAAGIASAGIRAQSVGGGGGVGGATAIGIDPFGVELFENPFAGGHGDGGAVSITTSGSIEALGGASPENLENGLAGIGILAQSIGGGGGIIGTESGIANLGSLHGNGAGGAVSIDHTGNILAMGVNSMAVLAQSEGGTGSDDISIALNGGTVIGGSGFLGGGVFILDGANNTFVNSAALSALNNKALVATSGNDTVRNLGSITGDIDLGSGTNSFTTKSGGTVTSTGILDMGGGTFTNEGHLQAGLDGQRSINVDLTGHFVQSGTGNLLLDLSLDQDKSEGEIVRVSGTADVDGVVAVNVFNPLAGEQRRTIIEATGGVTDRGLAVNASPVLNAELAFEDGTDVVFVTDLSFSEPGIGLTSNQAGVAAALDFAVSNGLDGFDVLFDELLANDISADDIVKAYSSLSGEVYSTTHSALNSNGLMLGSILSNITLGAGGGSPDTSTAAFQFLPYAPVATTSNSFPSEALSADAATGLAQSRPFVFAQGLYRRLSIDSDGNGAASRTINSGILGGGGFQVDGRLITGLAVGYLRTDSDVGSLGSRVDGNSAVVAGFASIKDGAIDLSANLGYVYSDLDSSRAVTVGNLAATASADFTANSGFGYVEAGYSFDLDDVKIRPFAAGGFSVTRNNRFSETGAGAANLTVGAQTSALGQLLLGIGVHTKVMVNTVQFTPHIEAAFQQELGNLGPDTAVTLQPGGLTFTTAGTEASRQKAVLRSGFLAEFNDQSSAFVNYEGAFSHRETEHNIQAGFKFRF